jgi:hypothetical protein
MARVPNRDYFAFVMRLALWVNAGRLTRGKRPRFGMDS